MSVGGSLMPGLKEFRGLEVEIANVQQFLTWLPVLCGIQHADECPLALDKFSEKDQISVEP